MASCAACGKTILIGGKKEGDLRFCGNRCLQNGRLALVARSIPDDVVRQAAREVHAAECPRCGQRRGPVDVHVAHRIYSVLLMTSWSSQPEISCRTCGVKRQLSGLFSSLLVGWWGVPWGVIMTPVQVLRNLGALLRPHESTQPSERLEEMVRFHLASRATEAAQRPQEPSVAT